MLARAGRKRISDALSGAVRLAYPGRLDRRRHAVIIPESSLSPWRFDTEFRETYDRILPFSLVDEMRLYELWDLTGQLAAVPGDILEIGVWRGGSGCLVATRSQRSGSAATVFLCDTFEGVVKAGAEDPLYSGVSTTTRHLDSSRRWPAISASRTSRYSSASSPTTPVPESRTVSSSCATSTWTSMDRR